LKKLSSRRQRNPDSAGKKKEPYAIFNQHFLDQSRVEPLDPEKDFRRSQEVFYFCLGNFINLYLLSPLMIAVIGTMTCGLSQWQRFFSRPLCQSSQGSQGKKSSKMRPHGHGAYSFSGLHCEPCGLCERKIFSFFVFAKNPTMGVEPQHPETDRRIGSFPCLE
jgi:hypothetical protein